MNRYLHLLLFGGLMLAASAPAAVIIMGNLPMNSPDYTGTIDDNDWLAVSFTTPSDLSGSISDVTLLLQSGTGSPILELCDDNGGNPGGSVLAFTSDAFSGVQEVQFAPSTTYEPSGSTTYWLVLRSSSSAPLFWCGDPSPLPTGTGTMGVFKFTSNGGSSWSTWSDINFGFEVTAVPEPGQWAMAGLTVVYAAACALRRWRANN